MKIFTKKCLFWGLILNNIFDLNIQFIINTHIEILVKINPKIDIFLTFFTLLYKHIFNQIAKGNYDFGLLADFVRKVDFGKTKLISPVSPTRTILLF